MTQDVVKLHAVRDSRRNAPTVVLGGSLGSDLSMWEPMLPELTGALDVVRYDLRGHGASPVPPPPYDIADLGRDLLALLERLDLSDVHLVGTSLGGMAAMWAAAHRPERIAGLVLCCTSALLGPPQMWADRAARAREEGTRALAGTVVSRWFTPEFAEREPEVADRMRAMVSATSDAGYAACCGAIERMDLRPLLHRIQVPTLVIAGAEDPATPLGHAESLVRAIPGARLAIVRDAAHQAPVEQPGAVAELILSHVLPGSAGSGDLLAARRRGMAVRREVLGRGHVDRAISGTTALTEVFQDFLTRYAWGEIWARDGLDRRTRSCVTLAVLTALGCENELAMHVRAARRNGLSEAEIAEVLLHTAVYAGVPAANTAFAVAQRVLADPAAGGEASADETHGGPGAEHPGSGSLADGASADGGSGDGGSAGGGSGDRRAGGEAAAGDRG